MNPYEVIKKPLVTEKSSKQQVENKYCFSVNALATKQEIKAAVEKVFKVKVDNVNVLNVRGKWKRVGKSTGKTSNWKKAVVSLKPGEKIEIFEGV